MAKDTSINDALYNLLKSGVTPDEMTEMINKAQKQLDADKEAEAKAQKEAEEREAAIDEAEQELSESLMWYFVALGIIDSDDEDTWDELESLIDKTIKASTKSIRNAKFSSKKLTGKEAEAEADKILKDIKKYDSIFPWWF